MFEYNDGLDVESWQKRTRTTTNYDLDEFAKNHGIAPSTAKHALENTQKLRENSVSSKGTQTKAKTPTTKKSSKKKTKKSKVREKTLKAAALIATTVVTLSAIMEFSGFNDKIEHDKRLQEAINYTVPAVVQVLSANDIEVGLVQDEKNKDVVRIDFPEEQIDTCMAIIQDEFGFTQNETLYAVSKTGVEGELDEALDSMGMTKAQYLTREGFIGQRDTSEGFKPGGPSEVVFENYQEEGFMDKVENHQEVQLANDNENTLGGK